MGWRLVANDTFYDSLDELDDTDETSAVVEKLILRIMAEPRRTERIGRTEVRALRHNAAPPSGFPSLVLFYTANDGVVTLLSVERDGARRTHD